MKRKIPEPFTDREKSTFFSGIAVISVLLLLLVHIFLWDISFWQGVIIFVAVQLLSVISYCKYGIWLIKRSAKRWDVHTRYVMEALEYGLHYNRGFWGLGKDEFWELLQKSRQDYESRRLVFRSRAKRLAKSVEILEKPSCQPKKSDNG